MQVYCRTRIGACPLHASLVLLQGQTEAITLPDPLWLTMMWRREKRKYSLCKPAVLLMEIELRMPAGCLTQSSGAAAGTERGNHPSQTP